MRKTSHPRHLWPWFSLVLCTLLISCGTPKPNTKVATRDRISPTYEGPKQLEFCNEALSAYSNPVTITGTAQYQVREPFTSESGGLGAPETTRPIRRAEIRVTNSSGDVVQCGATDGNGQFSLSLPRGDGSLNIAINSRANNSYLKASVLNAPERNQFYSLTTSVEPNQDKDLGTLTAGATGEVLGGAFNILDQILKVNDYLRSEAGDCSTLYQGCEDFTVAPMVSVYWEKGFNPGSYYDPLNTGLSFYLPGYSRLFILGGVNDDVSSSDTDHFDNSIIIHEYGHFLEDVITSTDSPGGSHNGNKIIDPRLAWSEGWGNFLQAAVQNDPTYIDTYGNVDGTTGLIFQVDLETAALGYDKPRETGEGNFREFSITRFLWDSIDDTPSETENGGTDNIKNGFTRLWASLTSPAGFKDSEIAYRSIGLLHRTQDSLTDPNSNAANEDWSGIETVELQQGDRSNYAQFVHADADCAGYVVTLTPYNDPLDTSGGFETSNLLRNNDFYHFKHGGGDLQLTMEYTTAGSYEPDLDLYLYKGDAIYGYQDDWAGKSRNYTDDDTNTGETESFTVSSLPAGDYLINVMLWTQNAHSDAPSSKKYGDAAHYYIKVNGGSRICPTAGP